MAKLYNSEAEQKTIITVLNGDKLVSNHLIAQLSVAHFGEEASIECMARVFATIKAGRVVPSSKVFVEDPILSDIAKEFITNIQFDPITTVDDATALVGILLQHKKVRAVLVSTSQIVQEVRDSPPERIDEALSRLENTIINARTNGVEEKMVSFGVGDSTHGFEVLANILHPPPELAKIPIGFNSFDRRTGGIRRGNLFTICGPSRGGKSAIRSQIVRNMYLKGASSVCVVSLEMTEEEELSRVISGVAGVPFEYVEQAKLTHQQRIRIASTMEEFDEVGKNNGKAFRIWVPKNRPISASSIIATLKLFGYDAFVIDYVGLVEADEDTQAQELGKIAEMFKHAAGAMNAAAILLAQFDSDNMRVKYSRAIFEHSDIVWGWKYGEKEEQTGIVTIMQEAPVGKIRNGKAFNFQVQYKLETMDIIDYENPNAPAQLDPNRLYKPNNTMAGLQDTVVDKSM